MHEANPNCKRCRGTGLLKDGKTDCICRYVEHEYSDEMGDILADTLKEMAQDKALHRQIANEVGQIVDAFKKARG